MKNITLIIALFLSLSVSAQDYTSITKHFDSLLWEPYVHIVPVFWVRGQPNADRLYVWGSHDNTVNHGELTWEVRGTVILDSTTTIHPLLGTGTYKIDDTDYVNWDVDSKYLFWMTALKGRLNVTIID